MRCFITGHVVHDGVPLDNERSIELSDQDAGRLVALGVARPDDGSSDEAATSRPEKQKK